MAILNGGVTVSAGPAAGPAGQAQLVAVDADGLRGLVAVRTDATGLAAGLLATIHLAQPIVADQDAWVQAQWGANAQNAGVFAGVEAIVTPFQPFPPAGVTYERFMQASQGQVVAFGVTASGLLAPSTTYRFSWRVLT